MAQAIAICDTCGFVIPAVAVENGSNSRSEADARTRILCPVRGCGGGGTLLGDEYGAAADTLAPLRNVAVSRQQWSRFARLLERAQSDGLAGIDIATQIGRDLPAVMNSIADEFRRTASQTAAASLARSLHAAINELAAPSNAASGEPSRQSDTGGSALPKPASHSHDQIHDHDHNHDHNHDHDHDHAGHNCADHAHAHARPYTNTQKKIGRNEPCWCGSGQKYKRCHGAHPQ